MTRSTRNTLLAIKPETTSGTDAVPTAAANAVLLLVDGLSSSVEQRFAERSTLKGSYNGTDKLPYARRGQMSFSVDLAASGTAGTAPAAAPLLSMAGFAETVTAGSRVDYSLVSTGFKTMSTYEWVDGEVRKFNYCAGSVKLGLKMGTAPTLDFSLTGLVTAVATDAVPTGTFTAWKTPEAISTVNTTKLKLGGTYSAGALSGGTDYTWMEFNLDLGNALQDLALVGQEAIAIDDRSPKCDFIIDATAAQVVAFYAAMDAGTPTSVGLVHGTAAGKKVLIFGAAGKITAIADAPQGNSLLTKISMDLQAVNGNDELKVVFL